MKTGKRLAATLTFAAAAVAVAAAQTSTQKPNDDLVVHEWGTLLALSGSDGVALDSLYHEEHALPAFVHARRTDQLRVRSASLKGETPVIYFYTKTPRAVSVRVGFPNGIWTQWFPQASLVAPGLSAASAPPKLSDGRICWNVQLVPPAQTDGVPRTEPDALWNFSRAVPDAAGVRVDGETERFIFYRGLGQGTLPLTLTAANNGTLATTPRTGTGVRHVFILRVANGTGTYRYLPGLAPGQRLTDVLAPSAADDRPLDSVADDLAARLTETGLFPDEARAMVATWRTSYFAQDGVRVLFVLPQPWTDAFFPMTISPKPAKTVRVLVGRLEMLTPERERLAENAVRRLAAPDAATRDAAFAELRAQGRYVEPVLRRVLATTTDDRVRTLCRRLLLTDFVTDLRAATLAPTDGRKLEEDPVFVRARLASLLREIGEDDAARTEAKAARDVLRTRPALKFDDPENRHVLRAEARIAEAVADDSATLAAYDRFIDWGSQTRTCGGCHLTAGPKTMAWFRDWWAGEKYAELAKKTGRTTALLAQTKAELARDPQRTAARMKLAYLMRAAGKPAEAERLWSQIERPVIAKTSYSSVKSTSKVRRQGSRTEPAASRRPAPIPRS